MFLQNFHYICIPYKFTQSECVCLKIKYEILAHKGSQTPSAMPGDYLAKRNPVEQQDLLASMTMKLGFLGKNIALQHFFYIAAALKKKTLNRQSS